MDHLPAISVKLIARSGETQLEPAWQQKDRGLLWEPELLPAHQEIRIQFTTGWRSDECWIHHPALIRMVDKSLVRGDEDWRNAKHSPLTGEKHFEEPIGAPGFGIFPPLLVFGPDGGWLLGPVSEKTSRCLWDWVTDENGALRITASLIPWALDQELLPHEILTEGWYIEKLPADAKLEPKLFESYLNEISRSLGKTPFQQRPDAGLTWASWNDGIFRDIDENRILAMADFAAKELSNIRWIQIDDGWAGPQIATMEEDGKLGMSDLSVFYRPDRLNADPRFPNGLKGMVETIKAKGLRPLLWITPSVMAGSDLYADHPEWFLDARLEWMPEMRFLDFSIEAVRDYVEKALDIVFLEWGFEGSKLDFWTMAFEETNVKLRQGNRTGVEWMGWFLEQVRSRMPADGLLLHCIGLPFGGPWRSKWCDHFRYHADTEGSCGNQEMVKEQALWAAFLAGLYDLGRFWALNGDGFGLFDHTGLPAPEHRRWAAFLLGSGSATEICGWLNTKDDRDGIGRVKLVCEHAALGCKIELPGYDFATDPPNPPSVWIRRYIECGEFWPLLSLGDSSPISGKPSFQRLPTGQTLIALTNWTDDEIELTLPLEGDWTEIFSGDRARGLTPTTLGSREGKVFVLSSNNS